MKIVSLFSGCGGLDFGFKDAGFKTIFANDIDQDSCLTYQKYFGHKCINADINDLLSSMPNAEVLIGGPPCQSFSMVGKREENDPRGKLVFSFLKAVESVNPNVIVMENVPGLSSSLINNKRLSIFVCEALDYKGYETYMLKLNSADFFVPQKRKRIIILGFKKGLLKKPFQLIEKQKLANIIFGENILYEIGAYEALDDLSEPTEKLSQITKESFSSYSKEPHSLYSSYMRKNVNGPLKLHLQLKMSEKDAAYVKHIPPGGNYTNIPDSIASPRILKFKETGGRTTTYGRLHPSKPSYTVNTYFNRPNVGSNYHYSCDRLITPREALRIQSFQDDFVPIFSSNRSLFRQIGNAVPPLLSRTLAESVKEVIF